MINKYITQEIRKDIEMNKILKYIKHPSNIIIYLSNKGFFKYIDDKKYLKIKYKLIMGKKIDLQNPQTFNEKLQWLKLYDRNHQYTQMVDKYEAKKYVASIIGEEYIIPTIGIYNSFDEIDFKKLPNKFVIKCTHDSGGLILCKNKEKLDIAKAKKKIDKCMKNNYYYKHREWPYKNVKPRIIIEEYLEDKIIKKMIDYKFFSFNGNPKIMYVSDNSHTDNQHCCFYDMNYKKLDIKRKDYQEFEKEIKKPNNFEKMIEFSKILSKDIPHVRVDWYEINGKLYFGELTFFTCSGFIPFDPEEWDYKLGEMLKLPDKKISDKNEK